MIVSNLALAGDSPQTSASRTTERSEAVAHGAKGFSPAGQLAMPWGPAQLALDGRAYAPTPDERSEESSLGLLHGDSPADDKQRATRWRRQLTMWSLLGPMSSFLPGIEGERTAKCAKVRCGRPGSGVQMKRSSSGHWGIAGCVICGNAHVCPLCAFRRARDTVCSLSTCIAQHLQLSRFNDAWLLTLTIPHDRHDSYDLVVKRLKKAWAIFTKSAEWRRFARFWGLRSVVRVFDATIGSNGLHAHWHVGLFPTAAAWNRYPLRDMNEWNRAAYLEIVREQIQPIWEAAVAETGALEGHSLETFREVGVDLEPGEMAASYLSKWGFAEELAHGPAKGGRTQWQLLDEFFAGDFVAGRQFVEYYQATKGTAVVTGLKRLRKQLDVTDERIEAHIADLREKRDAELEKLGELQDPVRELVVEIAPWFHTRALSIGWAHLQAVADAADESGEDVQSAVDRLLIAHRTALERRKIDTS